jgi:hypothetical protein
MMLVAVPMMKAIWLMGQFPLDERLAGCLDGAYAGKDDGNARILQMHLRAHSHSPCHQQAAIQDGFNHLAMAALVIILFLVAAFNGVGIKFGSELLVHNFTLFQADDGVLAGAPKMSAYRLAIVGDEGDTLNCVWFLIGGHISLPQWLIG